MKKIFKTVAKYIAIALVGAVLFALTSPIANAARTAASIGGEAFFLALPLFWWLVDETLKDYASTAKTEKVSKENDPDSPAETE